MKKGTCLILFAFLFVFFGSARNTPVINTSDMTDTAESANAGDQWFFRAVSGYPAAISFEPVVLFADGSYYEVGDEPVQGINKAADKQKRPSAWGTWKKDGETFLLTNNKGHTSDYKLGSGNWFPAYPYSAASGLKKTYEKVSGGDYGNGTVSLAISKITFTDATHFAQGTDAGISTPNATAGNKSSSGGTYKITAHTIELTMSDGKVIKKSFAIGAKGSPAKPDTGMIFIGGDAYTDTE